MKLSKLLTASFAIAGLASLPVVFPASAQTDSTTGGTRTTTEMNRTNTNDGRDDNHWGWLGLLGLAGLAGLGNRNKHHDDVVSRSSTTTQNRL